MQDEICGLQDGEDDIHSPARQIASEALYREINSDHGNSSYYPRLVLFDAKGSLGPISAQSLSGGLLSASPSSQASVAHTWDGRSEIHRAPEVEQTRFQHILEEEEEETYEAIRHVPGAGNITESACTRPSVLETAAQSLDLPGAVRYFTDFLKVQLHPRSLCIVQGLWRGGPELQAWGPRDCSIAHNSREQQDEAVERVRTLAEDSNSLSGFQCIVDDLSMWGRFAGDVLEELRDDYGSGKAALVFSVRASSRPGRRSSSGGDSMEIENESAAEIRRRRLCEALSTAMLTQRSDLFVPITPPPHLSGTNMPLMGLRWRSGDLFHESALCGTALSSATLPYRLVSGGNGGPIGSVDMWSMINLLTTQYGSPLGALNMSFPCPGFPVDVHREAAEADTRVSRWRHDIEHVEKDAKSSMNHSMCLASSQIQMSGAGLGGAGDRQRFAECVIVQGARSSTPRGLLPLSVASSSLDTLLAREEGVRCVRHRVLSSLPLPIPLPFPGIFAKTVTPWGDIVPEGCCEVQGSTGGTAPGHHVVNCPLLVRLAGTTGFAGAVRQIGGRFRSISSTVHGQAVLDGWGVDRDRVDEVQERLASLSNVYNDEDVL